MRIRYRKQCCIYWPFHLEDVTITVSETTDSVGGLIGAGKEMMEGSDQMSSFIISDCAVPEASPAAEITWMRLSGTLPVQLLWIAKEV